MRNNDTGVSMGGFVYLVLVWLALAFTAGLYAARRGRNPVGWAFVSLIASPLVAYAALFSLVDRSRSSAWIDPDTHAQCPHCLSYVPAAAKKCRHCASDLPGAQS
jgi:hypothetical protein